ncbi:MULTISPECIES: carboxylate--amine ligase [Haloferax]|uniref:carboxylate--amine ligase n=1 Tax=Haloferax TaxID=2251 RepID=UPI000E25EDC1|nr:MULTISPECIES: ATP-grasp domain-containing protein [Haloferax]RDZ38994.1 hypothetical protein C5B89_10630 [Haloferax sp. Atlit-47N]WEL30226.1 Putative ATP-grasp enzyme [Haloferax alexandrinus]
MSNTMKILVTDGRSLASLAMIRSLGQQGHTVHCGESFKQNLSSYSKYVDKKLIYPDPEDSPEEFVEYLLAACEQEEYDLVIPVRDEATIQLSKNKEEFRDVSTVYIPEYDTLLPLMDKGETVKIAQEANVPTPETWFPEFTPREEIRSTVDYPVLVRPRRSSGSRGIKYVTNKREFDTAFDHVERNFGVPIVQEYVSHEGGHYSIGTLFDSDSNEVATHVYKETKQYPVSGGPAVNAVSIEKPDWADDMLNILKHTGWVGPAHMDVLYDPESDGPKLLEVNPRLWMSIQIAISSGVDFPALLAELVSGNKPSRVASYDTDVSYRWVLPNEILWLLNADSKMSALAEFLQFDFRDECYGSLSFDDPKPVAGTIAQSLKFLTDPETRSMIFKRGWQND